MADLTLRNVKGSPLTNAEIDGNFTSLNSDTRFLTTTQKTDLTDAGDSALHYHATDRDRANHTGTQTLSTISDAGTAAAADTADLLARANHTGTQTLSTISDAGTAAAADTADLLARANHTGTQTLSTISDAGTAAAANTGVATGDVPLVNQALTSTATASTVTLGTTLQHLLTGTTTVTAFNGVAGVMYHCQADGAFLLTHHATDLIITQGVASVTTAAGDTFDVYMLTTTTCRIVNYQRADGRSLDLGTSSTAYIVTSPTDTTAGRVLTVGAGPDQLGFKWGGNAVINGAMEVAQGGTEFVNPANGTYVLDQWVVGKNHDGAATYRQATDAPAGSGMVNSLEMEVTTADASIDAAQYASIEHRFEGYNIRQFVDRTFTVPFRVKSSKTGVHCVALRNPGAAYAYVTEITVNAADTWEDKSFTVVGGIPAAYATQLGADEGLRLYFTQAAGTSYQTATTDTWQAGVYLATANQVNLLDAVGNKVNITDVGMVLGSMAVPLPRRPYAEELARCERYLRKVYFYTDAATYTGGAVTREANYTMRAAPTFALSGGFENEATLSNVDNVTATSLRASIIRTNTTLRMKLTVTLRAEL